MTDHYCECCKRTVPESEWDGLYTSCDRCAVAPSLPRSDRTRAGMVLTKRKPARERAPMADYPYPKVLAHIDHEPPRPMALKLVPALILPNKNDPEERWLLQCSAGQWRYMTIEDFLAVARQLSPEDAAQVREACER